MKIWITRSTAWGIQCGGLERLFVWFRKPTWTEYWRPLENDELPFGDDLTDLNGRRTAEWTVRNAGMTWIDRNISFGKLFGYRDRAEEGENEIAGYVWNKLCEHFGTTELDEFKDDEVKSIKNFLLEIDLKIELCST